MEKLNLIGLLVYIGMFAALFFCVWSFYYLVKSRGDQKVKGLLVTEVILIIMVSVYCLYNGFAYSMLRGGDLLSPRDNEVRVLYGLSVLLLGWAVLWVWDGGALRKIVLDAEETLTIKVALYSYIAIALFCWFSALGSIDMLFDALLNSF